MKYKRKFLAKHKYFKYFAVGKFQNVIADDLRI